MCWAQEGGGGREECHAAPSVEGHLGETQLVLGGGPYLPAHMPSGLLLADAVCPSEPFEASVMSPTIHCAGLVISLLHTASLWQSQPCLSGESQRWNYYWLPSNLIAVSGDQGWVVN
jgi:hypothetical protein